ncbi:unnamed protein product, partial [Phaeothamnion confervicola]
KWGKPLVIENRPGGDGMVAINAFMSAADHHVLLFASTVSFLAHPFTLDKIPYDLKRDFEPIARITDTITAYSVPTATGVTSLKDLFAAARAAPGKLNFAAAPGITEFTLSGALKTEGVDMVKVPYRDVVQAGTDLGEGRLQLLFTSLAIVKPHIDSGKARLVALGTTQRAAMLPGIPTVVEAGYPSMVTETSSSLFGPRAMPLALREKIAADMIAVGSDKSIADKLAATGQVMSLGGPAELAKTVEQQSARADAVGKALGVIRKN